MILTNRRPVMEAWSLVSTQFSCLMAEFRLSLTVSHLTLDLWLVIIFKFSFSNFLCVVCWKWSNLTITNLVYGLIINWLQQKLDVYLNIKPILIWTFYDPIFSFIILFKFKNIYLIFLILGWGNILIREVQLGIKL